MVRGSGSAEEAEEGGGDEEGEEDDAEDAHRGRHAFADLADIMRLSGEEGAQVYANLRARSAGMRSAMLNAELTKANEIGERMSFPMSILGVIFLALLVTPALLRLLGGT